MMLASIMSSCEGIRRSQSESAYQNVNWPPTWWLFLLCQFGQQLVSFCKMLRIKRIPRISRHFHWKHKVRIPSCKKAIEFMYCKAFEYVSVNYKIIYPDRINPDSISLKEG